MSDIKQAVQEQFGPVAANYRTSPVHAAGEDLGAIAAVVRQYASPVVLDVGCGAGHVARTVAPLSAQVVALDLTEAMLVEVRQLMAAHGIANVETKQGDVERLPYGDATFDVVISRYSAHHWPNPDRAIAECLRVLRPGGRLLISDIVAPDAPANDSFLQTLEVLRDPSHVRDHRIAEWQAIFARCAAPSRLLLAWQVPIDFQSWVARMATPADRVAALQSLLATASRERHAAFSIQADGSFTLQGALLEARRGASQ